MEKGKLKENDSANTATVCKQQLALRRRFLSGEISTLADCGTFTRDKDKRAAKAVEKMKIFSSLAHFSSSQLRLKNFPALFISKESLFLD